MEGVHAGRDRNRTMSTPRRSPGAVCRWKVFTQGVIETLPPSLQCVGGTRCRWKVFTQGLIKRMRNSNARIAIDRTSAAVEDLVNSSSV